MADNGYAIIVPIYSYLFMARMSSASGAWTRVFNFLTGFLQVPAHRISSSPRQGAFNPTARLGEKTGMMSSWDSIRQDAEEAVEVILKACSLQGFKVNHNKAFWRNTQDIQTFSDIREQMKKVLQEQVDNGSAEKGGPFGLPAIVSTKTPQNSNGLSGVSNFMPVRFSADNSPSLVPNTSLHKEELDAFRLELEEESVMNLIEKDFQVLSIGPLKSELLVNQLQISLHQSVNSLNEVDAKCSGYESMIKELEKRHKREIDRLNSQIEVLCKGSKGKDLAEAVDIDLSYVSPSIGPQRGGKDNSPTTRIHDLVRKESSRSAASEQMDDHGHDLSSLGDSLSAGLNDLRWRQTSQSGIDPVLGEQDKLTSSSSAWAEDSLTAANQVFGVREQSLRRRESRLYGIFHDETSVSGSSDGVLETVSSRKNKQFVDDTCKDRKVKQQKLSESPEKPVGSLDFLDHLEDDM